MKRGGQPLSLVKPPPKKAKTTILQVRIDEDVRHNLDLYAAFIESTPSYVVAEALKLLFKRDEEFKRWAGQHTNSNHTPERKGEESLVDPFKLA
jgi:predicted transcriptional regulator